MSRRINLIIVPDDGGQSRSVKLSVFWLKFAMWVGIAVALLIIGGALSYSSLARRALDYDRLERESAQLQMENHRIISVAREVEQSRKVLAQIIRSLGGHIELGRLGNPDSLAELGRNYEQADLTGDAMELLGGPNYAVEELMSYGLPTQMPVDGFISRGFSVDYLFPERSHRGIDIAGKTGTPVKAAAAGRVVFSGWTPYFGNFTLVAHDGGYLTFYGHNQVNLKSIADEVKRGEPIALLGTSGRSSAPHLHFEIWKDGVPVDPNEFVGQASD